MKFKFSRMKSAGVLVCAAGLIGSPFAQTRTLVTPADSVGAGGKTLSALDGVCTSTNNKCVTSATLPGYVAPMMPTIPSNICTADNNYCVTAATVTGYVLPLIPAPTPAPAPPQGSFCGQVIYTAPDSQGYVVNTYAPQGTTSERHCNGTTLSLSGPWYAPTGIANCPSGYLSGMTGPSIPGFAYLTSGPDGGATTIYGGASLVFTCFKN